MPRVRYIINDCSQSINKAIEACDLGSIPSDFDHRGYLRELNGRIYSYDNELKTIQNKIESTDDIYNNISREASARINGYKRNMRRVRTRPRLIVKN